MSLTLSVTMHINVTAQLERISAAYMRTPALVSIERGDTAGADQSVFSEMGVLGSNTGTGGLGMLF